MMFVVLLGGPEFDKKKILPEAMHALPLSIERWQSTLKFMRQDCRSLEWNAERCKKRKSSGFF